MTVLLYIFGGAAVGSFWALAIVYALRWLHDKRVLDEVRGIRPMSNADWDRERRIRTDLMKEYFEPREPQRKTNTP